MDKLKFYAVSDLHLDLHGIHRSFWHNFDNDAVLIIAGDTANALNGIAYVKNFALTSKPLSSLQGTTSGTVVKVNLTVLAICTNKTQ